MKLCVLSCCGIRPPLSLVKSYWKCWSVTVTESTWHGTTNDKEKKNEVTGDNSIVVNNRAIVDDSATANNSK